MATQFVGKLTACALAVMLAACGSGGSNFMGNSNTSSTSTTTTTTDTSSTTTDTSSTSTTTDSSTSTSTTTDTSSNSNSSSTTTDSGTTTTTDTSTTTTDNTIIKYPTTEFDKSQTFDSEFNWGGVATQQPHLRNTKHVLSGGQLDKVVVDGLEIMLMKAAQKPRLNVLTSGGPSKVTDPITEEQYVVYSPDSVVQSTRGGYSYTWFGIVNKVREDIVPTNKAETIDTMIAHGKLTDAADVPTTGSAEYKGHAIYYGNGTTNAMFDPNKLTGTTQFNVDYGNKTVAGTIKDDAGNVQDIQVEGKITGNSFAGTKNNTYNGKSTDVEVNGRFFGPQAAEMGGVFNSKNTDDILGAFGAKKQ